MKKVTICLHKFRKAGEMGNWKYLKCKKCPEVRVVPKHSEEYHAYLVRLEY